MTSQREKCQAFDQLHRQAGIFLIPNPWDLGSAKLLQGMGFKALATTSAGAAFSLGCSDGEITLEQKLAHCTQLANATSIPLNADFENGFATEPQKVANNVLRAVETGIAGCSIEDFDRDAKTLYEFGLAVERVSAAAEAVASLDFPFLITARAENLIRGVKDLDDTINRLQAFAEAGADVLYAPGLSTLDQLREVNNAVNKPLNVLAPFFAGVSVDELAGAGAKRVSVGSALNLAAVNTVMASCREMLEQGTFAWTANMANSGELKRLIS